MKKIIYYILILLTSCLILVPNAYALNSNEDNNGGDSTGTKMTIPQVEYDRIDDFAGNCADFASTIRIGGYLVVIIKVALPLIIIVKASMSFISVVTNGRPDELKKRASKLATSLIAAVIIFFIPTVVYLIFGFIDNFNENMTDDSKICVSCVFKPFSKDCSDYADKR